MDSPSSNDERETGGKEDKRPRRASVASCKGVPEGLEAFEWLEVEKREEGVFVREVI
jgi:hypothetical protein